MRTNNTKIDIDRLPCSSSKKEWIKHAQFCKERHAADRLENKRVLSANRAIKAENAQICYYNQVRRETIYLNKHRPKEQQVPVSDEQRLKSLVKRVCSLSPEDKSFIRTYYKTNRALLARTERQWWEILRRTVTDPIYFWHAVSVVWWDWIAIIPREKVSGLFERTLHSPCPNWEIDRERLVDYLIAIGYPIDYAVRRLCSEDSRMPLAEFPKPRNSKYRKCNMHGSSLTELFNRIMQSLRY